MKLLRLWIAAAAIAVAGIAAWAFAPMLVFVALLTLALGGVAGGMIQLAYRLRAWRERR